MISNGPLIPMWIGLPLGIVIMLIVAAHVMIVSESTRPASRRRIRLANGGLMLVLIPLLTAGFSLVDPQREPRLWVIMWLAALPMLCFVVLFAGLDVLNTWRLMRRRRVRLRAELLALEAAGLRSLRDRAGAARDAGSRAGTGLDRLEGRGG